MYKFAIMAVAVALLSGCGSYPRYSVTKGFEQNKWSLMTSWKEKRHVDVDLAEDGREWNRGWPGAALDKCVLRRENKETFAYWGGGKGLPPLNQSKEDIDCTVWDATHTRPHRYGPF
jgi:hypothetical protein